MIHTIAALATPPTLGKYSTSIPFLRRPKYLTGRYAGDVGFDPLGLATSIDQLVNYREAEVKHARIAMLVSCEVIFTSTNREFDYSSKESSSKITPAFFHCCVI